MVEELPIPVFVVTGSNWTMTVPLDAYNAQFDVEKQRHEAATRALEVLNNKRDDCFVVMNPESKNENPRVGVTVLVHVKDANPETAVPVATHECLADAGLYQKSIKAQKIHDTKFAAKVEQIEAEQVAKAKEAENKNILKQIAQDEKKKKKSGQ